MDFSRCDITWGHVGVTAVVVSLVLALAVVAARKGWIR
tara:strand:- start:641 stop:754 length:114 start_codon:yes stop_codon:yes gene_type:complete